MRSIISHKGEDFCTSRRKSEIKNSDLLHSVKRFWGPNYLRAVEYRCSPFGDKATDRGVKLTIRIHLLLSQQGSILLVPSLYHAPLLRCAELSTRVFFSVAQEPSWGLGHLVVQVSRSHTAGRTPLNGKEDFTVNYCRSWWPRGLRRRSAAARLLGLWVRIPPGAWKFVCCECCVFSGRGLCDELITRPEESYRLWCVVVCDLETS